MRDIEKDGAKILSFDITDEESIINGVNIADGWLASDPKVCWRFMASPLIYLHSLLLDKFFDVLMLSQLK